MKSIQFLIIALLMPLLMACEQAKIVAPPDEPDAAGPLFCDVEERRIFTTEEAKYRAAAYPDNLRRDIKTNATGEKHCGWKRGGRREK